MKLGRRTPTDWRHIECFALRDAAALPTNVPIPLGINWYSAFDHPTRERNGLWWIGKGDLGLGSVRGGHCVCIKPSAVVDWPAWWDFYDQGNEGACVGFGCSHMMTLLNRRRYDARWLWDRAKEIDEWSDTNPGDDEGTSVRAALEVLRTRGHVRASQADPSDDWTDRKDYNPDSRNGIWEYRWATTVDELLAVCGNRDLYLHRNGVPILNSWGRGYPHYTWLPLSVLQRLLDEDGEAAVVTDKP